MEEKAEGGEVGSVGVDREMIDGSALEFGCFFFERGESFLGRDGEFAAGFDFSSANESGSGEGFFGGVSEEEDGEVVFVPEDFEGGDGAGVVKIGEDEDEAAFAEGRV